MTLNNVQGFPANLITLARWSFACHSTRLGIRSGMIAMPAFAHTHQLFFHRLFYCVCDLGKKLIAIASLLMRISKGGLELQFCFET